jgi:hypothetical protein
VRTWTLVLCCIGGIVVLIAGAGFLFTVAWSGWPDVNSNAPASAEAVSNNLWSGNDYDLDAALTKALVRASNGSSVSKLVVLLDAQGFLAKEQIDGRCLSRQSNIDRWTHGCRSNPEDIAALKKEPGGEMWYYWQGPACSYSIRVSWDVADNGRVQNLAAYNEPVRCI